MFFQNAETENALGKPGAFFLVCVDREAKSRLQI
jgi:hypothetical protein